jgi:hypothetical protein
MSRPSLYPWIPLVLGAVVCVVGLARAMPQVASSLPSKGAARGLYLTNATGCGECHTPKIPSDVGLVPDLTRQLSGHPAQPRLPPAPRIDGGPWVLLGLATGTAWSGPWGTSFAANLTPDKDTGLGKWTERIFIDAMRTGRHMGQGRLILPPMPVQAIGQFDDDDLSSIFAHLHSLPALRNPVPDPLAPGM